VILTHPLPPSITWKFRRRLGAVVVGVIGCVADGYQFMPLPAALFLSRTRSAIARPRRRAASSSSAGRLCDKARLSLAPMGASAPPAPRPEFCAAAHFFGVRPIGGNSLRTEQVGLHFRFAIVRRVGVSHGFHYVRRGESTAYCANAPSRTSVTSELSPLYKGFFISLINCRLQGLCTSAKLFSESAPPSASGSI
jgi:hypothetical protein